MMLREPVCNLWMSRKSVHDLGLARHSKVLWAGKDNRGGGAVSVQILENIARGAETRVDHPRNRWASGSEIKLGLPPPHQNALPAGDALPKKCCRVLKRPLPRRRVRSARYSKQPELRMGHVLNCRRQRPYHDHAKREGKHSPAWRTQRARQLRHPQDEQERQNGYRKHVVVAEPALPDRDHGKGQCSDGNKRKSCPFPSGMIHGERDELRDTRQGNRGTPKRQVGSEPCDGGDSAIRRVEGTEASEWRSCRDRPVADHGDQASELSMQREPTKDQ